MAIKVLLHEDPTIARDAAEGFLASTPVANNLVATLLASRIDEAEPGRYWVAFDGGEIAGMAVAVAARSGTRAGAHGP